MIPAIARHICQGMLLLACAGGAARPALSRLAFPGDDGRLVYSKDARGNTVPDFSYAGYGGGGVRIPDAVVKVTLDPDPAAGDDAPRIQAAIDQVSNLPIDANGLRGAVLLRRGQYNVARPLTISADGVVLRGQRAGADGTVLRATMKTQGAFIQISGVGERREVGPRRSVVDDLVPLGRRELHLDSTTGLRAGDGIVVQTNTNEKWVHDNGVDKIGSRADGGKVIEWTPGPREAYERTLVAVEGNRITLDIPLTTALQAEYGGALVYGYAAPDRIRQVGVENLRAVSVWTPGAGVEPKPGQDFGVDPAAPENRGRKVGVDTFEHADTFLSIDKAQDVWVRDFVCVGFFFQGVAVMDQAKRVTVQDGDYEMPDPALGFYRVEPHEKAARYAYCLRGEMTLVQRCTTTHARHSFMTQKEVAGPNVFLGCDAYHQDGFSETHQRWSTGVLYDGVGLREPTALRVVDRGSMGTGHGWSGAYSMLWNCVGELSVESPPTAVNWAVGCTGKRTAGPFGPMQPQVWDSWGRHVQPESLYRAQLRDRLGAQAVKNIER